MHSQLRGRVRLFATLRTVTHRAPLSREFSRQEYWSGLAFLLQGIFLTQGSNPCLLRLLRWQAGSLPLCHLGSAQCDILYLAYGFGHVDSKLDVRK